MTRNRDIRLEDLTECDHKPILPISEDGQVLYWICRCGKKEHHVSEKHDPRVEVTKP